MAAFLCTLTLSKATACQGANPENQPSQAVQDTLVGGCRNNIWMLPGLGEQEERPAVPLDPSFGADPAQQAGSPLQTSRWNQTMRRFAGCVTPGMGKAARRDLH